MNRRTYTAQERTEAVGLAMSVGPVKAARQLGIPVRTVTNWTHSTEATVLRIATQADLVDRLREAMSVGIEQVLAGLRDPKARLGDKAAALRVVSEQHALLTGHATSRTENLNIGVDGTSALTPEQADATYRWIQEIEHATHDEIREWAASGELKKAFPTPEYLTAGETRDVE